MTNEQRMVQEFHRKFGLTVESSPTIPSEADYRLRIKLVREEDEEFYAAQNLVSVADALADLLYVIYGSAVTFGMDLEPIFREVHRSNMSKLWTRSEVDAYAKGDLLFRSAPGTDRFVAKRAEDGKVIKSPSYSPADIAKELRLQGYVE